MRWIRNPYLRLLPDVAYAIGNGVIGFWFGSWWFVTAGAYYAVLAVARFSVLQVQRRAKGDRETEWFARRITGILLVLLSFCVVGITVLSVCEGRGTVFHEIVMIGIATYTTFNIVKAIIDVVKARHSTSPALKSLRNIALANTVVSVFAMQRSMLVSFPGMSDGEIRLFNILTGSAVSLFVLFLGINLIGGKHVDNVKKTVAKANGKIADTVVGGYKAIEKGVVDGYKKIEKGVVDSYTKVEDAFVESYLTKDGETVEEAKARLSKKK